LISKNKQNTKEESLVSNIIYQIFENYIIDVMGFLSSNKIRKLEELESELKKKSDSLNAQLVSTYCEIIDEAIFKDRAGREKKDM
jgi:glycerol-3-phosphate O-acyltransferase